MHIKKVCAASTFSVALTVIGQVCVPVHVVQHRYILYMYI